MGPVAVLGMGRMGAAMARRLAESGFEVVVWNRTREGAEAVARSHGAAIAGTPAEASRRAAVVVASLADDRAVEAVHLGPDGTRHGVGPGSVVVETSTIDPGTVTRVGAALAAEGAALLDAPVSGSVPLVEQGTLTAMVGGEVGALDEARPVLAALTARIFHMGAGGTGATMKLAINALVHATNLALAESLVLAERAGIDRLRAYEVFASGVAASPFVLYKRPAFEDPDHTPVAFSLDLVAKDLDLILGLAARLGVPMAQGRATAEVATEAIAAGMGAADMSALAVHLRRLAGEQ